MKAKLSKRYIPYAFAAFYVLAGINHFVRPQFYLDYASHNTVTEGDGVYKRGLRNIRGPADTASQNEAGRFFGPQQHYSVKSALKSSTKKFESCPFLFARKASLNVKLFCLCRTTHAP
ncbi:MAG: hypothetical protein V4649_02765 [Bacteroidota bacterium]